MTQFCNTGESLLDRRLAGDGNRIALTGPSGDFSRATGNAGGSASTGPMGVDTECVAQWGKD